LATTGAAAAEAFDRMLEAKFAEVRLCFLICRGLGVVV